MGSISAAILWRIADTEMCIRDRPKDVLSQIYTLLTAGHDKETLYIKIKEIIKQEKEKQLEQEKEKQLDQEKEKQLKKKEEKKNREKFTKLNTNKGFGFFSCFKDYKKDN